jgi:hypothetical protein
VFENSNGDGDGSSCFHGGFGSGSDSGGAGSGGGGSGGGGGAAQTRRSTWGCFGVERNVSESDWFAAVDGALAAINTWTATDIAAFAATLGLGVDVGKVVASRIDGKRLLAADVTEARAMFGLTSSEQAERLVEAVANTAKGAAKMVMWSAEEVERWVVQALPADLAAVLGESSCPPLFRGKLGKRQLAGLHCGRTRAHCGSLCGGGGGLCAGARSSACGARCSPATSLLHWLGWL